MWKKIKQILRKLAGKDLPKSVTEQPEPRYLFRDEPPDINIEKAIIQRAREEWLPQPTKTDVAEDMHRTEAEESLRGTPYDRDSIEEKEQRMREEWLPKPTTKRKTRDKSHRPPAAEHDIGELMKGKGTTSKRYRKTIKESPQLKIEEEEDDA